MKLECVGTGYINSQIIEDKLIRNNNEEIKTCYFQFANYKYTDDKNNKKIYSYFLCQAIGNIASLILENFIKGQKIFIKGEIEQKSLKNTENKKYNNITIITINWIEFMNKANEIEIKNSEDEPNIEKILKDEKILNIEKNNTEEAFY